MSKKRDKWRVWSPDSQRVYTQQRILRASAGNRPMLRAFAEWLAKDQQLEPGTIATRLGFACSFVDAVTARAGRTCAPAFRSLSSEGVEELFVRYGRDHGIPARRSMQGAMRSFLAFAAGRGWVGRELIEAVPSLSGYRLGGVPRGLSDEQLERLLAAPWKGWCPRRDRAIVYLLASYGVRRGQVSALQLDDIDWRSRTIDFAAHKGGKAVHHGLTAAVAQALTEDLRQERPASACPYVFLRRKRPYLRLGPPAISSMVTARAVGCGLPPRSPHAFRHAFATRLLRAGQPVKAIADLLGHRSLAAVAIYAKVDLARLLEVAIDWPEAAS